MGRTADWLAHSMTCPSATQYVSHEMALCRNLLQVQHQLAALCINDRGQETVHHAANLSANSCCLLISKVHNHWALTALQGAVRILHVCHAQQPELTRK